jgi:hypothetical protein
MSACSGEVHVHESSGQGGGPATGGQGGGPATGGEGGSCVASIACGSHCVPPELYCSNCLGWCPEECPSRCGSLALLTAVPGPPPGPIALDDTLVYFGTGMDAAGSVMAVSKEGGDIITVVPDQGFVISLAVDSQSVYWAEKGPMGGPLKIAPKTGGTAAVLVDTAMGVAIDATSIYYWKGGGSLEKMPLGGGVPVVLATGVSPSGIWDIAVSGDSLYWLDWSNTINSLPVDGGNPTPLLSIASSYPYLPRTLAVDSASLYWLFRAGNPLELWRAKLDGSDPSVLFMGGDSDTFDLAVDTTGVYVSTFVAMSDGSSIERVPLTGGASTTLASGPGMMPPSWNGPSAHGFALDASYVYWTSAQGYVGKTAK